MLLTVTEPTQFLADQQCVVTGYYKITRMSLDHSPIVTGGVTCMLLLTQHNTSVPRTLPIHYPSVTEIRPSRRLGYRVTTRYPSVTHPLPMFICNRPPRGMGLGMGVVLPSVSQYYVAHM